VKVRNPNIEIRNKSESARLEIQNARFETTGWDIRILNFVLVSKFEFRISNFLPA